MKPINAKKNVPGLAVLLFIFLFLMLVLPDLSLSESSGEGQNPVIYVRIDGITGPSQDINHKVWIEALSFSMGVVDSGATVGGGGGGGRGRQIPVLKPVTIVKPYDIASPILALDAAKGVHLRNACIEVSAPGSELTISPIMVGLEEVQIASVDSTIAEGYFNKLKEVVTLTYQRIYWQYNQMNPDGTIGPLVISGWDAGRNVPLSASGGINACR